MQLRAVDDVVGVDGGEDEVAGEGGVDGELGGFGVADFADEDLVGVVAEDGTEAAGEGETLLLVDRNLGDAADLVFDGILDGDDLVFFGFDLVEGGVEGGGLAGAGGAGDEHHAVGLLDVAAEAAEVFGGEPNDVERELGELLRHGLFVEHAEDGVFAMYSRHDGDAEVDEAALVADTKAAVLGDAALGDVELGHDLDAGQDRLVVLAGDRGHGLLQDAVDAVLDEQRVVEGFEMDIGGAAFERGKDGGVDEADDGREIVFAGEALDGDVLVGIVFGGEDVEGETFGGLVEDAL